MPGKYRERCKNCDKALHNIPFARILREYGLCMACLPENFDWSIFPKKYHPKKKKHHRRKRVGSNPCAALVYGGRRRCRNSANSGSAFCSVHWEQKTKGRPTIRDVIGEIPADRNGKIIEACGIILLDVAPSRMVELYHMDYKQYLETDEWKRTRIKVLEHYGSTCMICGSNGMNNHIHHRHYKHRGFEYYNDMSVLCVDCHKFIYEHHKARMRVVEYA